jgi:poly-gamma-glutamate synthesis protein (capsule biosynthesis protein)
MSPNRPVTLFLCGDVMTGRGVDQILPHPSGPEIHERLAGSALDYVALAEQSSGAIPRSVDSAYIWGDALEPMRHADARIVNLETSITTSSAYVPKGINYRMHPANVECLCAAGIDCAALANNHMLDWGREGLADTIATLRARNIAIAGAGRDAAQAWAPAVLSPGDGVRLLVFAAGSGDSGIPGDWAAGEHHSGVAWLPNLSHETVEAIRRRIEPVKRPGDIVVFSIHWGANWGYQPEAGQREFAHRLIDLAGVSIVHGHSSHHPRGVEFFRGKLILYGCGDFINDYEGISGYEEFRSHLVLGYLVTLDTETGAVADVTMLPFETRRFRLTGALPRDAHWLAQRLQEISAGFGSRIRLKHDGSLGADAAASALHRGSSQDVSKKLPATHP